MWVCAILKFATAPLSEWNFLCLLILDRPGLNFNAINLNFHNFTDGRPYRRLQSVKVSDRFLTNWGQDEIFVWQKFFLICKEIHNIEICDRLLWVRWYHGNSNDPPYWNAEGPSSEQYELIKPRERPAIWWISTFPWYHITQRGWCKFQYCGNTHFPAISILSG